jgi:hypothetical protein
MVVVKEIGEDNVFSRFNNVHTCIQRSNYWSQRWRHRDFIIFLRLPGEIQTFEECAVHIETFHGNPMALQCSWG